MSQPQTPQPAPGATGTGSSSGPAAPTLGGTADWPAKAADAVDLVVATINDKAVRPLVLAARVVVFGIIVAALSALVVVFGAVGLVRLLDVYAFGDRVWASDLLVAVVLLAVGTAAWSLRTARAGARPRD